MMSGQKFHLWQCDIVGSEDTYPVFWDILEPHERAHAESLSNLQSRLNYAEIHGRLRILLADVVNSSPKHLRILKAEYGKPYLIDYPELSFNLSHTGNKLIVVYAYHHNVGVDIETCKKRANLAGLVEKCFAEEEQNYWRQLPHSQQTQAFYRFWTRKEAFVKAVGRGIALGLNQCVINPNNRNRFIRIPKDYGKAEQWLIQDVEVGANICGALAVKRLSTLTGF